MVVLCTYAPISVALPSLFLSSFLQLCSQSCLTGFRKRFLCIASHCWSFPRSACHVTAVSTRRKSGLKGCNPLIESCVMTRSCIYHASSASDNRCSIAYFDWQKLNREKRPFPVMHHSMKTPVPSTTPSSTVTAAANIVLFFPSMRIPLFPSHLSTVSSSCLSSINVPPLYFSGASGNLSITYLPFATLIIGTPGIFLNLLLRSLSFVATR